MMNQTAMLVSIISLLGCLLLALGGFAGRRITWSRTAFLALIWLAIVAAGTWLVSYTGLVPGGR